MNIDSKIHDDNIRTYYTLFDYRPLEPSLFVKKYGDLISELLHKLCDSLFGDKVSLLLGYYAKDVNIRFEEIIPSICNDTKKILSFNILLYELIFDILYFSKFKDTTHFIGIFRKYIKLLVGEPLPAFSEWLDSKTINFVPPSQEEEMEVMKKALVAVGFVFFHELVHETEDLKRVGVRLYQETDILKSHISNLNPIELEELSCDFNALYSMTSPQTPLGETFKKRFHVSATDVWTYGIVMLHANPLLQMLTGCFSANAEIINRSYQLAKSQLMTRTAMLSLVTVLTQNTDELSMGDLDPKLGLSIAMELITSFFDCCNEMLNMFGELLQQDSDVIEFKEKKPIDSEQIWFRIK